VSATYTGPQCPLCTAPLELDTLRAGATQCPSCSRTFEATPFQPVDYRHEAVQVVTQTPDGVAAACANHARNAAVTSCQRCGLFICALCEMNVGDASYCPSCFDRVHAQGTLQERYRDYASMAVSAVVVGFLCYFVPSIFAIYWAVRGIQQRRREGRSIAGMIVTLIFAIMQTLSIIAMIVLMIVAFASESTK
jgi:hypothetical protein